MIPTANTEGCKSYASTHTLLNYSHMEIRSREEHIEMPITEAIYNVLYNKADIKEEIGSLMTRDSKSEVIGKRK